jgi:predicted dienelactone hydrolase/ABC-type amino acid transport substrate-binding protein
MIFQASSQGYDPVKPVNKLKIKKKKSSNFLSTCVFLCLGIFPTALKPKIVLSAEKIYIPYGPLEISVSVDSLETFAKSGEIHSELEPYAKLLDAQTLAQLRQSLQWRFNLGQVAVSRVAHSPTGEMLLKRLGRVIQSRRDQNGFSSLRAALISAAGDPQGLSLITVMRRFPSEGIWMNTTLLLELQQELTTFANYRDTTLSAIAKQMDVEASVKSSTNFSKLPDARQPGNFKVSRRTLDLTNNRNRQSLIGKKIGRSFEVDLYLPEGISQPAPMVVLSHGLGADRRMFVYLAEHLASHGFAVVVPEHIGSNTRRRQALLEGLVRSDFNPVEFIDRSLDIKYTLDQLELQSQGNSNLAGRLDPKRVVLIGHSTGGYTALAMAGAEINHERLNQECQDERPTLNVSLILQCLGNRLPAFNYNLYDPRIKAAIAINPFVSTVLGPENLSNIQIPIMIMGSSGDVITPVVPEQIHPFLWLKTAEKYLVLMNPSGHAAIDGTEGTTTGEQASLSNLGRLLAGPEPRLAQEYLKALSLGFVQTYLSDRPEYRAYLSAAYAKSISREPVKLELVRSLTPAQLEQAFGGQPPLPIFPKLATVPIANRALPILEEIKKTGILRAGVVNNAAPWSYKDSNGNRAGYCIDMLNSLTAQLQQQLNTSVKLEIAVETTLENRFEIVQKDQVYLTCGPNSIRTDINGVTFSTPFFITGTHFLVPRNNQDRINPTGNLRNVSVGVLRRTTTEQFIQRRYPQAREVHFERPGGISAGLQALSQGNIDALASDGIILITAAITGKIPLNQYALIPEEPLTCDAYGMVMPANDRQWQNTVNTFIGSREARTVWDKWFKNLYPYIYLNLDYCADR